MRRLVEKLRNRTAAFVHDLFMIPLAWLGAYWLRFNLESIPAPFLDRALQILPLVVLVQGACAWYFGLYRGVWRFASLPDLVRILRAVIVGTAMVTVAVFMLTRMQDVPRSVFPLYALLLAVLLGGPRLFYRWLRERSYFTRSGRRVLIVGAGRAGEMLARDLLRDQAAGYSPVGFVDDDPKKKGRDIHGVRVVGQCKHLARLVREHGIELVLLAVPSASTRQMRRLVDLCEQAGVEFRTLPRMQDLVSGRSTVSELRAVSIEDLLGREPVSLDWEAIGRATRGHVVLVSGGGGSIGAELCRQLARLEPATLVVLEQSEFNLYEIERELRAAHPDLDLRVHLGDVGDEVGVDRLLAGCRPDVIYHAAAYKHVPMLEHQVRQAVRNNVLGTRTLALAAARHGVGSFVLISSDKAVNPANVMGASKRVAELLVQNADAMHSGTRFITVRFGNVLDSAGSVVPLFRRQIAAGGPVTVTHPEVKRYFMTIPEACQLIMQAAAMGEGGEIFVLDMGEPIRIGYLAEQMVTLAGKVPGEDIEIRYVGLRPGEKLFEELFHEQENLRATSHPKLLLARSRPMQWNLLQAAVAELGSHCENHDEPALREWLRKLVPEYQTPGAERAPDNVVKLEAVKK